MIFILLFLLFIIILMTVDFMESYLPELVNLIKKLVR